MTDDLVKRFDRSLAENPIILGDRTADRIEQLEQRLEAAKDKAEAAILDLMAERYRAEARLDKAVDALRRIADAADRKHVGDIARTVLAEIEGGKT